MLSATWIKHRLLIQLKATIQVFAYTS